MRFNGIVAVLGLTFGLAHCAGEKPVVKTSIGTESPATKVKKTSSLKDRYHALAAKNLCPQGYPRLQGTWRFVGQSKTPDFRDTLTIKGTAFVEKLSGRPGGKSLKATLRGEVRCLFKNRVLVMTRTVKPDGAFGNRSGDAFPCDVLSPVNPSRRRMLMVCFFDWNNVRPAKGLEFEYQAVTP